MERLTRKFVQKINGRNEIEVVLPAERTVQEAVNRLAELEDKIENGTLVELPCKVGTTIFWADNYFPESAEVEEIKLTGFGYNWAHKTVFMLDEDGAEIYQYNFGKEAFFTREEAEKRLEELRR